MIGKITRIISSKRTNNAGEEVEYLTLHILNADGTVQKLNTNRKVFMSLNGNIPDEQVKSYKWDYGYYISTTKDGYKFINLQYLNRA
jgi:hypothetical protein